MVLFVKLKRFTLFALSIARDSKNLISHFVRSFHFDVKAIAISQKSLFVS